MRNVILIGICLCGVGLAADAPYAGKWKMNVAKSNFGESTVTFDPMAGGAMKMTMDGQSYTFKNDGAEVATPWGSMASWKKTDANTYQLTDKVNAKVTNSTIRLSPDGKMMTMDSKR